MAGGDLYLWTPRHGHAVPVIDRHAHHRAPYIRYSPLYAHSRDNSGVGYLDSDTHGHPDPIAYSDTVPDRITACRDHVLWNGGRRFDFDDHRHHHSDAHSHPTALAQREP